jgi:hypothetical protein
VNLPRASPGWTRAGLEQLDALLVKLKISGRRVCAAQPSSAPPTGTGSSPAGPSQQRRDSN